jgi:hypothetical protein
VLGRGGSGCLGSPIHFFVWEYFTAGRFTPLVFHDFSFQSFTTSPFTGYGPFSGCLDGYIKVHGPLPTTNPFVPPTSFEVSATINPSTTV